MASRGSSGSCDDNGRSTSVHPSSPEVRRPGLPPHANEAGNDLVLKVAWRHTEAEDEADGLRAWNGNGAVCLHRVERFDIPWRFS